MKKKINKQLNSEKEIDAITEQWARLIVTQINNKSMNPKDSMEIVRT
jgi:hypothetical protein